MARADRRPCRILKITFTNSRPLRQRRTRVREATSVSAPPTNDTPKSESAATKTDTNARDSTGCPSDQRPPVSATENARLTPSAYRGRQRIARYDRRYVYRPDQLLRTKQLAHSNPILVRISDIYSRGCAWTFGTRSNLGKLGSRHRLRHFVDVRVSTRIISNAHFAKHAAPPRNSLIATVAVYELVRPRVPIDS